MRGELGGLGQGECCGGVYQQDESKVFISEDGLKPKIMNTSYQK